MKPITLLGVAVAILAGGTAFRTSASGRTDVDAAPIYGVKIPAGYRDWTLISIARVGLPVNDMRAKLGNDVAIRTFREGTTPFRTGL
jgi:hypothetical protein